MSQKSRIAPDSPALARNESGRVLRAPPKPNPSARDDEPTRVAPLPFAPNQSTVTPGARTHECESSEQLTRAPSARASRITLAPNHREPLGGHYHVPSPEHGTTEIPLASDRPPRTTKPPAPRSRANRDTDAYFECAELLLQRGDYRGAVLVAQRAMKLGPVRSEQQALYAWLLYERDGRDAPVHPHVFRHLDSALARDAWCVDAHCYKGVLLARMGHIEQARVHLTRALELDPDNRPAARALRLIETPKP